MNNVRKYIPRYSDPAERERHARLRSEYIRRLNAYRQRIKRYQELKLRERYKQ